MSDALKKMQQRLGKATKLISDDGYLPMFRNRQLNYTKEFDFSVKLAIIIALPAEQ